MLLLIRGKKAWKEVVFQAAYNQTKDPSIPALQNAKQFTFMLVGTRSGNHGRILREGDKIA